MTSIHPLSNASQDQTDTPVIGILCQPWVMGIKDEQGKIYDYSQVVYHPFRQFLVASYVKWLEASGARIIPVPYTLKRSEIVTLFKQLNGFVLPGGDGAYPPQAQLFLDVAIELNQQGSYFPILGICLGFQYISTHFGLINGWKPAPGKTNFSFLDDIAVHNQSNPLTFTDEAKESKWYQECPNDLRVAFENEPLSPNFHNFGVTMETYNKYMKNDFLLVSTAYADVIVARDDEEVVKGKLLEGDKLIPHPTDETKLIWQKYHVTQIEHKKYPIFATQHHPEKTIFEWGVTMNGNQYQKIARTRNAIFASQYTSMFFTFQCRQSTHQFHNLKRLYAQLIYHHPKHYFGAGVTEIYFFDNWIQYDDEEHDTVGELTLQSQNKNILQTPVATPNQTPIITTPTNATPNPATSQHPIGDNGLFAYAD